MTRQNRSHLGKGLQLKGNGWSCFSISLDFLCSAADGTISLTHARRVLYHLAMGRSPSISQFCPNHFIKRVPGLERKSVKEARPRGTDLLFQLLGMLS